VFVNQIGGNDDLVFDGNSLVFDGAGREVAHLSPFASDFALCEINPQKLITRALTPTPPRADSRPRPADLLDALILGLRDYVRKSGFHDCVLGLSGGIDSALACYIAAAAVGAAHVHGLALPSRYSSEHSVADARKLAEAIGIDFEVVPINAIHAAYEATPVAGDDLASQPAGLADQNLQARIRGALVMIRSNRHGWLALATGNKSELAVGYCTLYGDMAGGFAVLADVFKRDVYAVSQYINHERERREVIPAGSLTKAPSAELAPNQFDQDTLPPYPLLDAILEGLIEREMSVATLSRQFPPETVRWVAGRLDRNEFKRRQMPPGIKLSQRAFGSGRRMPMAARFDWE
jgi:NAD+ synthase (glutamine-hydrolysing)